MAVPGAEIGEVLYISSVLQGSFSAPDAQEWLVLFRFYETPPHVAGFERTIAALYDSALSLVCQHSLAGDKITAAPLRGADGQSYLLALIDTTDTSNFLTQKQELFQIGPEGWTSLPLAEGWTAEQTEESSGTYTSPYCVLQGESLFGFSLQGERNEQSYYDHTYLYQYTLTWDGHDTIFKAA